MAYLELITRGDLTSAGYAWLTQRFDLEVMPHYRRSWVSDRGERRGFVEDRYQDEIYPKGYWPGDAPLDHLIFALKYDGMNLQILYELFKVFPTEDLCAYIKEKPLGKYARKLWFLYEFLTEEQLPLADLTSGKYLLLLEEDEYEMGPQVKVKRHRVVNNLMGTRDFCPMVRDSKVLRRFKMLGLDMRCRDLLKQYPEDLLSRAAHYLFNKETRTSFEIEGELPAHRQVDDFVSMLHRAGEEDFLNKEALLSLQNQTVDPRFAGKDYRDFQSYIGQTVALDREIVHFAAPKPEDIVALMKGWEEVSRQMLNSETHPVVVAAVVSFSFVLFHPFDDGNGRIHRFLIHHVLSQRGYTPKGLIFPISAVMLKKRKRYDALLESFSKPLMKMVNYTLNREGQMMVLSDTASHFRFMDLTQFVEGLFEMVEETIDNELTAELEFLRSYDAARTAIKEVISLPDRHLDLFIRACLHNQGRLSKTKRKRLFGMLSDEEVERMEHALRSTWKAYDIFMPA